MNIKEISIEHFGFYTQRKTRTTEYEWLYNKIKSPCLILDIGTGTSPLPIALAEQGNSVVTVDYWTEETQNEWGFIDYHIINPQIESFNVDFTDYLSPDEYDVIYSISALEHMPRNTRRGVIFNAYEHLVSNGWFYATIDVRKETQDIWNKSYGQVIEDDHGTISDVIQELKEAGFSSVDFHLQTGIKGIATDLLFIEARK